MGNAARTVVCCLAAILASCDALIRDTRRPTPALRTILLAELGPPPTAAAVEAGAWSVLREQLPTFGWSILEIGEPGKGSYRTSWITDFDRYAWSADVRATAPECGPQDLRLWLVGEELVAWTHLARAAHGSFDGDIIEPGDRQGLDYTEAGKPDDARKRLKH
jgi:hypothetical protein